MDNPGQRSYIKRKKRSHQYDGWFAVTNGMIPLRNLEVRDT